ncbi:MAG: uroporphyrinogen-III synthase [Betaproteobacteria bacterium]|nr:uroporphyrinogen-III synthase [Betaproteobacteria bacterium]
MSAGPLSGQRILVTRPARQAAALSAAIEAAGGEALNLPLIEIEPVEDQEGFRALAAELDAFVYAFFVSANAVEHGLACVRAFRAWPPGPQVATVGPGSAKALHEAGFAKVLAPAERFDSEGVLALPEFAPARIAGQGVLILRGDGGRELLADELRARGARVCCVTCYRRTFPPLDIPVLQRADALTLSSSEAVRHLAAGLREQGLNAFWDKPVFVPHIRIAVAASDAGFTQVIETAGGDAGLMQGLLMYYGAEN